MSEYRVDLKVRNNIILKKIEQTGYKTIGEFCRLNNIMKYVGAIGDIVSMKRSPLNYKGEFLPVMLKVSELLNCDPLDLFSDTQLHTILKSNRRSIQVNEAEMKFMIETKYSQQQLLEDHIFEEQKSKTIEKQLDLLTPKEAQVLKMRYGLGEYTREHTLKEIGEVLLNGNTNKLGIDKERIRQIEAKALRKLRNPKRSGQLRGFLFEEEKKKEQEQEERKEIIDLIPSNYCNYCHAELASGKLKRLFCDHDCAKYYQEDIDRF